MKKPGKGKETVTKKRAITTKKPSVSSEKKNAPSTTFQPEALKKDLVRQTMITILWKMEDITFPKLTEELKKEISHHFNQDLDLYIEWVRNDLETKKLLEESPGKKPTHYRLAQKLDRDPEDDQDL